MEALKASMSGSVFPVNRPPQSFDDWAKAGVELLKQAAEAVAAVAHVPFHCRLKRLRNIFAAVLRYSISYIRSLSVHTKGSVLGLVGQTHSTRLGRILFCTQCCHPVWQPSCPIYFIQLCYSDAPPSSPFTPRTTSRTATTTTTTTM